MKVLLAYRCPDELSGDVDFQTLPPGLLSLGATLRAAGHAALVANFSRLPWKSVEKFLAAEEPELIGVACTTVARGTTVRLLRLARRACPTAVTAIGGPHAGVLAATWISRVRELDFVVTGDGELAMAEACERLASGGREALDGTPGVLARGGGPAPPPAWPDPRTLPSPLRAMDGAGIVPERDLVHLSVSRERPGAASPALRPPSAVAAEARELRDRLGLLDVRLTGSGIVADREVIAGLAHAFVEGKAGVAWDVEAAAADLSPDGPRGEARLARALADAHRAGCRRVRVTLDAADVEDGPGAAAAWSQLLNVASRVLRRAGLSPHLTVLFGTREQTPASLQRLRSCIRAFQPREGQLVPRLVLPGDASASQISESEWFEDDRVPVEASLAQLEHGRPPLEQALAAAARSARPSHRDLEALTLQDADDPWTHVEWGDYWSARGDVEEARRHHLEAARLEPWSAHPWLHLARALARGSRPDAAGERAALGEALNRAPRHEPARERLAALKEGRRGGARA